MPETYRDAIAIVPGRRPSEAERILKPGTAGHTLAAWHRCNPCDIRGEGSHTPEEHRASQQPLCQRNNHGRHPRPDGQAAKRVHPVGPEGVSGTVLHAEPAAGAERGGRNDRFFFGITILCSRNRMPGHHPADKNPWPVLRGEEQRAFANLPQPSGSGDLFLTGRAPGLSRR
jgi:hypothetical protein